MNIVFANLLNQSKQIKISLVELHHIGIQLAEVEHVVNHLVDIISLVYDFIQIIAALVPVDTIFHAVGAAAYHKQRRFDVVRKGVGKVGALFLLNDLRLDHFPNHKAQNQSNQGKKHIC